MSKLKSGLDAQTRELLIKSARQQIENGLTEMVIDLAAVRKKRKLISPIQNDGPGYGSLDEHYQAIHNCSKCPLGATRTKFVYGDGHPHADIMFIGEAPGRDEDLRGIPFVGRAGQLLDKILEAVKLKREEIYIANMLKCRPPSNRDPLPEEMAVCFPYLAEQIRLVKPRLICALGRISAQAILQTSTTLGQLRKKWHDYAGIPLMVTYHPAALLRFPGYKRDTWEDIQMLRARYDQMTGSK